VADRYVWSGATGAANGTSWADAYTTLAAAAAVDTAGDTIYVAHDHAENSTSAGLSYAWASSGFVAASWTRILCVNRSTNVVTTGAEIKTTGNYTISTNTTGQGLLFDGLSFVSGDTATGASAIIIGQNAARAVRYKNTTFDLRSTSSNSIGAANVGRALLENCWAKFGNSAGAITPGNFFKWTGGGLLSSSSGTTLVNAAAGVKIELSNLDLSGAPTTLNVFGNLSVIGCTATISNSKMPDSWTGSVSSSEPTSPSTRVSLYNCDSADTNYRLIIKDFSGSIFSETTIVRTGGATDGTTPISWRMVCNSNANDSLYPLISDPISVWNETVGSALTITVEIVHDSVTALEDNEVWVDVEYLGTSGRPLGATVSDQRADVLTTAVAQTSSSEAWTTTGLTNPNKQKLSVSITPQEKGFITARACLAKAAAYTIYVDSKITVT
jgi:hypothetical protein